MNILIVGAGPTGLTAALECTRQGIVPEIVDAKDAPSPFSRAVGILPNSLNILQRTGVAERIIAEGEKIRRVHIERDGKSLIDLNVSNILKDEVFLLCLPQDRTESLMSERLKEMGVSVQYGTRVNDINATSTNASVTFENGSTKSYDWVIGADGVHSTVRKKLNIPFEGYELDEDWSIADVELASGYDRSTIRAMLLKGAGRDRDAMVMVPITGNRVRLISSTPDSLAALPFKLDIKNVRRSGSFKISVRQAQRYVQERVLLAGDAAHAHSPVGGRGMNLGIDDAQAAVTAILNQSTYTYEIERKKIAEKVIRETEAIRKILVSNNPLTVALVKIITSLMQHVPALQKRFARKVMEF